MYVDDDGDGIISRDDLYKMLDKITNTPGLNQENKDWIITCVRISFQTLSLLHHIKTM